MLKIFWCYAHKDEPYLDQIKKRFIPLQQQELIETWYDRDISAGIDWEHEIEDRLNAAQIILLLISSDFMASNYAHNIEMKHALERHREGTACIIPILVRPVDWEGAPFSKLQMLPTNAKPITKWPNRDEAYMDIELGIKKVIKDLSRKMKREEIISGLTEVWENDDREDSEAWFGKGFSLLLSRRYKEALGAFRKALSLDPVNDRAWTYQGCALDHLGSYEEALKSFEEALLLDPTLASIWFYKGQTLNKLKRYEEALTAFKYARQLDPTEAALVWKYQGYALDQLKRYNEALRSFEEALLLNRTDADAWVCKGNTLSFLQRYEEALKAYGEACNYDSRNSRSWNNIGWILLLMFRQK